VDKQVTLPITAKIKNKIEIIHFLNGWMEKFITNKFKWVVHMHANPERYSRLDDCGTITLCLEEDCNIAIAIEYVMPSIQIQFCKGGHDYVFYKYNGLSEDLLPEHIEKYKDFINYFKNGKNRTDFINYYLDIYNLVHNTDYLILLPKAYTFLICNKKNKLFPRGVDKIIINKLLFFKIEISKLSIS
jgi:hypothetical protein